MIPYRSWRPGDPIYDPMRDGYGWSRVSSIVGAKLDLPHDDDCTGTNCRRFDDAVFRWIAEPDEAVIEYLAREYDAPIAEPGTEFYGAVIGAAAGARDVSSPTATAPRSAGTSNPT